MAEGVDALRYAVRLPVVAKYLGQLGIMLALLNLAPLVVALLYHEWDFAMAQLSMLVVMLLLALPVARLASPQQQLQGNEALVIVSGAFILAPLFMAVPFAVIGLPIDDALFEAISAITTTGLTTVRHLETMPQSFLFSRAWMQWYGGLGIVVLSVALLMGHHVAARRLAEPAGSEGMIGTARTHARRMLMVYLLLTFVGIAIAVPVLGDGMVALNHILAAVSTGGFSTDDQSLAALRGWPRQMLILLFAWCGAVPLFLYYRALHGNWRSVVGDSEVWLLAGMVCVITLLLYLLSAEREMAGVRHSLMLAISAQTTTGFSTSEVAALTPAAKLVVIVAMFTGGGLGSTAGGIKLLRLLLLFKLLQLYLRRSSAPEHAVIELRLGGHAVSDTELLRTLVLIVLFAGVVLFSWLIFLAYGYPAVDALFEVVSATGTVGLTTGITSDELPGVLKGVLAIDMLLGRLEIIALLVLFYPPTWFGKRLASS